MAKHKNDNIKKQPATSSSTQRTPLPVSRSLAEESPKDVYTMSPGNIIVEQNMQMKQQDDQLVDLEASVLNLRNASLTINEEVNLQSHLLDDVHARVDGAQNRQLGTQAGLRSFVSRGGNCKLWMLVVFLLFILVLMLSVLK